MAARKGIGIGLMGFGVIGGGVAKVLMGKSDTLGREAGSQLVLKKLLEKDLSKHGLSGIERGLFTTQFEELVGHPEVDIVVELIGGEHPAFEYIREALTRGKHVVTANKEVISKHWSELLTLARDHQVAILYKGSVGGDIHLIAP